QKSPPRNHRRWTTTTALENLDRRRCYSAVVLALADRLDLHLGALVRIARLLVSLLVRLQSQTRALLWLGNTDSVTFECDLSALPATLRSLRFRKAHDHSQQPAVSVFPG